MSVAYFSGAFGDNAVWVFDFDQPEVAKRFPGRLQSPMFSNAVQGNNCEQYYSMMFSIFKEGKLCFETTA